MRLGGFKMAKELNGKRIAFMVANEGVEQVELTDPRRAVEDAGAETELLAPESGEVQAFNHLDRADKFPAHKTTAHPSIEDSDGLPLPLAGPAPSREPPAPSGVPGMPPTSAGIDPNGATAPASSSSAREKPPVNSATISSPARRAASQSQVESPTSTPDSARALRSAAWTRSGSGFVRSTSADDVQPSTARPPRAGRGRDRAPPPSPSSPTSLAPPRRAAP